MKTGILIFIFSLLSILVEAQSFPVANTSKEMQEILRLEGRRRPIQFRNVHANTAIGGSIEIGSISSMPGFISYVERIEIVLTKAAEIEIYVGAIGNNPSESSFAKKKNLMLPKGRHPIDIYDFAYQGSSSTTPFRIVLYDVYDDDLKTAATDKSYMAWVQIEALEIYEDFTVNNPRARPALWIGDSVMRGQPGSTQKEKHYVWLTKQELRKKGIETRNCNRALGGSTSVEHDRYIQKGMYDTDDWGIIFYNLGVNDATTSGTYQTDYQTALQNAVDWKKRVYPNAVMVIIGCHKSSNSTTETKLANLRSIAQTIVTTENSSKILFCNLGSVDLSLVSGAYYADASNIHLTDTGYAAIWTPLQTFIQGNF